MITERERRENEVRETRMVRELEEEVRELKRQMGSASKESVE